VIRLLQQRAGTRYDPKAVQAFIKAHPKLNRQASPTAVPQARTA